MTTIGQHRRHTGPSNRGEATMDANATGVTIRHGLVHQPRIVIAIPALDVGDTWISMINSTTFAFNCQDGTAARCAIYWHVE